jgi:rhamnogalacturonan endolyase
MVVTTMTALQGALLRKCRAVEPNAPLRNDPVVVLDDDFHHYRSGNWLGDVGAHLEYHYLHEIDPHGPWYISAFRDLGSQLGWKVIDDGERKSLAQTSDNKVVHTHPLIVAGDALWSNYTLRVQFTPESNTKRSGMVFRARNDRCYYFFGMEKGTAVIRKVQHDAAFRVPNETVLAETKFDFQPGTTLTATVTANGSKLRCAIEGGPILEAEDGTYPQGKIGLLSDTPTRYHNVRVTMTAADAQKTSSQITERQELEHNLQTANPNPKLWQRINTANFGAGRNIRFGDLNNDGTLDILIGQITHHGPQDTYSELSCLTALTLTGEKLWQLGTADSWKHHLTNDVAFQIHDFDGDGKTEVVYSMNQELIVADGGTGNTRQKIATPENTTDAGSAVPRFPRILGDSLYFCDLRGKGHPSDLIIKDRYKNFWVFDEQLQPLFQRRCNTGHYPFAIDVDHDGHDELFVGYSCYDHKGNQVFTLENEVRDHADSIGVVQLNSEPIVICCASDEGIYFADLKGNIIQHHRIGHAQNCTVANFRDDLPGLETLTINFWGNQGIVHLFDSRGMLNLDSEPCQHGSELSPVNWTGKSEEFFMLSANVEEGGLFDGLCRRVVLMPNDGHPDMCSTAIDLTGDCRDELVVWSPQEIWIYTQDDNPRTGKLYHPKRSPTYNNSNYRMNISLPHGEDRK